MIRCIDCGVEEPRRSPNHKRCQDCAEVANKQARGRGSRVSYHRVKSGDPDKMAEAKRRAALKSKYNLTPEQYDEILAIQGGVCYICQKPPKKQRLAVDHNHWTKETRGLLCKNCNYRLLGGRDRNPDLFRRAYEYLTNPPARKVLS